MSAAEQPMKDDAVNPPESAENDAPGSWLVYDYDYGPYAISLHESAEIAARGAARQGYGRVGFWPYGMELREAVDLWEGRVIPPVEKGGA